MMQAMQLMMMPNLNVPEFNQELSYEAWKSCLYNWTLQIMMPPQRQLLMILESLKNNKERPDLKQWIITAVIEDPTFNKSSPNAVANLMLKMDSKFSKSNWKISGEIWDELLEFKVKDGETPKKYVER